MDHMTHSDTHIHIHTHTETHTHIQRHTHTHTKRETHDGWVRMSSVWKKNEMKREKRERGERGGHVWSWKDRNVF